MPAKDIYHDSVKNALIKDQWTITHDSLTLKVGKKDMFVDLGAEKFLAAQKQDRKIAVEIKSFIGASEIEDLRNALGQYILYENALELVEPDRILYLAIRELIFYDLFEEVIGRYLLEKRLLKIVVFDPDSEVIVKWID
ncbi:XisH family protein [Coleofasciculus sp. G2-EDA-02]|uniref:XisH family protein n=1 Tax=unclassified Coleofasciculus TaxID=2692782 RepID=UPI0032F9B4C3